MHTAFFLFLFIPLFRWVSKHSITRLFLSHIKHRLRFFISNLFFFLFLFRIFLSVVIFFVFFVIGCVHFWACLFFCMLQAPTIMFVLCSRNLHAFEEMPTFKVLHLKSIRALGFHIVLFVFVAYIFCCMLLFFLVAVSSSEFVIGPGIENITRKMHTSVHLAFGSECDNRFWNVLLFC